MVMKTKEKNIGKVMVISVIMSSHLRHIFKDNNNFQLQQQ